MPHPCCSCCRGANEHEKDAHQFRCPSHQPYPKEKK